MLSTSTAQVAGQLGGKCYTCGPNVVKPSPVTGAVALDVAQPGSFGLPIGPRQGASFAAVQANSSTQGVTEMCAGTDLKADWWKFALAALAGYFYAKS